MTNDPLDSDNDRRYRFTQLKWTLQALAAAAPHQLALYPADVCKVDELALDFDDWWKVVKSNYASGLTEDQSVALEAIDEKLCRMSRCGPEFHEQLWTDSGLEVRPEWALIRELARRALSAFDWPVELPPQNPEDRDVTYVPG